MDERAETARRLFGQGKTAVEIAKILGISPGTVRSWKSRGNWSGGAAKKRNVANKRCNAPSISDKLIASVEGNEELTDKQQAFCLHYVRTFNATSSYQRAYGCDYATANAHGYELLSNVVIRAEIKRLKKIRAEAILAGPEDIVDRYMRIAFADLSDYVEWGRTEEPVVGMYGPVMVESPGADEKVPLMQTVNDVRFRESSEVDGTLVAEVKIGRDGASIKLADRMKALQWLSDYFELNPADRRKADYDKRRLELETLKTKASIKDDGPGEIPDDGFTDALNAQAADNWAGGDDDAGSNSMGTD